MNPIMMNFSGKRALITGGTRGIGKSIMENLFALNCEVIYTGRGSKSEISEEKKLFKQLDLTDNASLNQFIAFLKDIPQIDILINNAGINIIESIDEINIEHWEKVLSINLSGAMLMMREVARIMKRNKKGGKILNVSSIFGVVSKAKRNAYSASKAGLIGLTKAAALDLASHNILVNALCPGFTMTDLTKSILSEAEIKQLCSEIPLGRFASEEEIAKTAVFLCSDLNTYMTGQTVVVDGGYTIR